jgi:hypothetical protein
VPAEIIVSPHAPPKANHGWTNAVEPVAVKAAAEIAMDAGSEPVDMMPRMNWPTSPLLVEPVPINPNEGTVLIAAVVLPSAARPTFVRAPSELDVPTKEPADNPVDPSKAKAPVTELLIAATEPEVPIKDPAEYPAALKAVAAVVPVMIEPAVVPRLPTNGASRKVKLLVADATEVVPEVARLTNQEMLFVAF